MNKYVNGHIVTMDKIITVTIVIPHHTCSAIPIVKVFLLTEAFCDSVVLLTVGIKVIVYEWWFTYF